MRPAAVVLTILITVIASGCTRSTGPATTSPTGGDQPKQVEFVNGTPTMKPGNHWVQRLYYADTPGETVRTIEYYLDRVDQVYLDSGRVDTYRLVVDGGTRTVWLRYSDWALVKEIAQDGDTRHETTYDPPCQQYQWPLTVGQEFHATCHRIIVRLGDPPAEPRHDNVSVSVKVEASDNVTVAAGTFQAFRILATRPQTPGGVPTTEYFVPSVCFPARIDVTVEGRTLVAELVNQECG